MKMTKRVVALVLCLTLVFSLSIVAYAASSKTFFSATRYGYTVTGRGTTDTSKATATMIATPGNSPSIPENDCSSTVTLKAYSSNDTVVGSATKTGTTEVRAECRYSAGAATYTISSFRFNGYNYGPYNLNV